MTTLVSSPCFCVTRTASLALSQFNSNFRREHHTASLSFAHSECNESYQPKKARKETLANIEITSEGPEKAKWNDMNIESFLKVCVEEIEVGNRPHTHFTKEGWANIVEKFHKQTGKNYDKKQLKNRWDALKQEFGIWAKLVEKETGLEWDPIKQTIIASSEWWATKAKENPKYLIWKEQGPKFLSLMEKCFKGVVATGYDVFIPNKDLSSTNDQDESPSGAPVVECEGDTDEHSFGNINEGPSEQKNIKSKRKKGKKGIKRSGLGQQLQQSLDRILDSIDQVSQTTVTTRSNDCFSITRCLTLLKDVPGLEKGSRQYLLATRIFVNDKNRETFVHLMEDSPELVLEWLSMFTLEEVKHYK